MPPPAPGWYQAADGRWYPPPPGPMPPGGQWGPGGPPPKKKGNKTLWLILALVGICFFGVVALGTGNKSKTQNAATAGTAAPGTTVTPASSSTTTAPADPGAPPTEPPPSTEPPPTEPPTTPPPPSPEQRAKDITTENLSGTNEVTVTTNPAVMDIMIKPGSVWDEVSIFRGSFFDAGKVMPKLFADPVLAGVNAVCMHQVVKFTDPMGQASEEDATRICLTRVKASGVNFDGTDPDRLYFATRGSRVGVDGIEFYVHPGVLKEIEFE